MRNMIFDQVLADSYLDRNDIVATCKTVFNIFHNIFPKLLQIHLTTVTATRSS